jgi:hypothetical protein
LLRGLLCAASLSLAGCPWPCGSSAPFIAWHFEDDCANDLCDFTVASGQATRTTALAAGEHALQLAPGTEIDHTLTQTVSSPNQAVSVSLVAKCENNATMSFTVVISETRAGDGGLNVPNLRTLRGTLSPLGDWTHYNVPLNAPTQTGSVNTAQIVSLSISNDNTGRCWVDDVGVAQQFLCE